jgi:hypothetical protein
MSFEYDLYADGQTAILHREESDSLHVTGTEQGLKLVAIGGGTGLSTVLAGLKRLVGQRDGGQWLDALSPSSPFRMTAAAAGVCATNCKSSRPAIYATAWLRSRKIQL